VKVVAVVLILLQALVALALFTLSVHGPPGLPLAGALYFLAAAALTWWAARRSWPILVAAALAAFAAAPGTYALLDYLDRVAYRNQVAGTTVSEVRDEPILSPAGRVIGVRLSYAVAVPRWGYHGTLPFLYGDGRPAEGLRLESRRWTFDGRGGPELGPFQAGKGHRLVVELYPPILHMPHQGAACLVPWTYPLPPPGAPAPLRVDISETPYARQPTQQSYDLPTLYRNVAAEGWRFCKVGQ
jgi:hypothetical protein